jgi:hypothetical protein
MRDRCELAAAVQALTLGKEKLFYIRKYYISNMNEDYKTASEILEKYFPGSGRVIANYCNMNNINANEFSLSDFASNISPNYFLTLSEIDSMTGLSEYQQMSEEIIETLKKKSEN